MGIKRKIYDMFVKIPYVQENFEYLKCLIQGHKTKEIRNITDKSKPIYYIIGYEDIHSSGWTIWERVALYGAIYAEDKGYIPVMDMKSNKNIYQEYEGDNSWERYYYQLQGVSVEEALDSNNYIIGDISYEWFCYLRTRKSKTINIDYLRKKYKRYIRLRPEIVDYCNKEAHQIIPNIDAHRMMGVALRGTDYTTFNHPQQPSFESYIKHVIEVANKYKCDSYYLFTEDKVFFDKLNEALIDKIVYSYKAGQITSTNGELINKYIRKNKSAREESLDYLTKLYILDKCQCLVGGMCGGTIVAEYRKNPSYDYYEVC